MEKKKLIGIPIIASFYILLGMIGLASLYYGPNGLLVVGSFFSIYGGYCIFKREKHIIQWACGVSVASGLVGMLILVFYFIDVFYFSDFSDYSKVLTGLGIILVSIIIPFYLTRPRVKEQFK